MWILWLIGVKGLNFLLLMLPWLTDHFIETSILN